MPKRKNMNLTPQQKIWLELMVHGATRDEIFQKVFGIDYSLPPEELAREQNKARCKMWHWKNHPAYETEWRKAWREAWGEITYKAMDVVLKGMDDKDLPWRATQSASLALAYGQKNLIGDDEGAVKVEIVGMPDLGTPDGEEK